MRSKLWPSARGQWPGGGNPNGDSPQLGMTSLEEGVRGETGEGGTSGSLKMKAKNCGQDTTRVGVWGMRQRMAPLLHSFPILSGFQDRRVGQLIPLLLGAQLGTPQGTPVCPQESPGLAARLEVGPSFSSALSVSFLICEMGQHTLLRAPPHPDLSSALLCLF